MWDEDREDVYKKVIGAKILAVDVWSPENVELVLEDGRRLDLKLYGDCCSHSYYTDTTQFLELLDATIQVIEDRDGGREDARATHGEGEDSYETDVSTHWHFLSFTTDKGHTTIDWRNDSNGYYDGSVEAVLTGPPAN